MLAVDPLTAYVARLVSHREAEDDGNPSIYDALIMAKRRLNIPDSSDPNADEFPDDAHRAAAVFVEHIVNKLSAEATEALAKLFTLVKDLELENINEDVLDKLRTAAVNGGLATVHLVAIARPALSLVDYEHVADQAIAAGKRRLQGKSDDAQQPTDGPSDFTEE
jgi:hypothetical protein